MLDFSAYEAKSAPDFSAYEVKPTTVNPTLGKQQVDSTPPEDRVLPVNPVKQGVAGLSDILTGIPAVPGMLHELVATTVQRDDDPNTSWGTEFMKNLGENPFVKFSHGMRMGVNKLLDIPEPVSLLDQPLRLAASFAIPGPGWITKGAGMAPALIRTVTPFVKAGTKKQTIARGLTQLGIGGGMDQGMRAYIESDEALQNTPAATLMPTMWNPNARPTWLGGTGGIPRAEWEKARATVLAPQDTPPDGAPQGLNFDDYEAVSTQEVNDEINSQTDSDIAMDRKLEDNERTELIKKGIGGSILIGLLALLGKNKNYIKGYPSDLTKDMPIKGGERPLKTAQEQGWTGPEAATKSNREIQLEEWINEIDELLKNPEELAQKAKDKQYAPDLVEYKQNLLEDRAQWVRFLQRERNKRKASAEEESPTTGAVEDGPIKSSGGVVKRLLDAAARTTAGKKLRTAYETGVDQESHAERLVFEALMTKPGMTAEKAQEIARNTANASSIDSVRAVKELYESGNFSEAFNVVMSTEKLAPILRTLQGMSKERQKIFNDGLLARTEKQRRAEFGEGASFVRDKDGNPWSDTTINSAIHALKMDDELFKFSTQISTIMDDMLKFTVARRVLRQDIVDGWKAKFVDEVGNAYLPGMVTTSKGTYLSRLARLLGHNTTKGKELGMMARFKAIADDPELPRYKPLDPISSIQQYMHDIVDFVNRNNAEYNMLSYLSGTRMHKGTVVIDNANAGQHAQFVGRYDSDVLGNVKGNIKWSQVAGEGKSKGALTSAEKNVRKKFNFDERTSIEDWIAKHDDLMVVTRDGESLIYNVPDPLLRSAIKMDRKLTGYWPQFFNQWSKNMMALTTGRGSPFGFAAFLYNQQVSTLAVTSGQGFKEGAIQWLGSFRGIWQHFSHNVAKDISTILTRNLDREFGLFQNLAPEQAKALRGWAQKKIQNVMMQDLQTESGLVTSAYQGSPYSGNITNALESVVMPMRETYGANALPFIWRTWKNINDAFHEGPALAKAMRLAGEAEIPTGAGKGKFWREVGRQTREVTGDVNKLPSNPTMRNIHASIPYWGAMWQGWSVAGRALKKNPGKFGAAVMGTIVFPTAMEIIWNSTADGDQTWDIQNADGTVQKMTKREHFWKFLSPEQRNNSRILYIPGKHPSEAIIIPAEPMFSLVRGTTIELMDLFFNLSDGVTTDNGDHMLAGLTRFFDIPTPPPLGAAMAFADEGKDFRIGLNVVTDPEEGKSFSFLHAAPRGNSRVGGDRNVRATGDEFSIRMGAVVTELGGAGMQTLLAASNAYFGGRDDVKVPFSEGFPRFLSEAGLGLKKSARFVNPLFPGTLSFNPNNETTRKLFAARTSLTEIVERTKILNTGGMSATGRLLAGGDTLVPTEDPIEHQLMTIAPTILAEITKMDGLIKDLKDKVTQARNANKLFGEGGRVIIPKSAQEKQNYIDAWNLDIATLKALQWQVIETHMQEFNEMMSRKLRRNINIDLTAYSPRSNLMKESTSSPN